MKKYIVEVQATDGEWWRCGTWPIEAADESAAIEIEIEAARSAGGEYTGEMRAIDWMLGIITCVCGGRGCFICNQSGITTKRHINGFQVWQIESARNGR